MPHPHRLGYLPGVAPALGTPLPSPRPIAALLLLAACTPPAPARPALSPLLRTDAPLLQPALSADGALLVTSDGVDLWLRTLVNDETTNLTADFDPAATSPTLAPDGAHVAFVAEGDLYLAGPRAEDPQRLVAGARDPAFAPDSAHIAYTDAAGLWLTDLAGSPPQAVLRTGAPADPAFSPDGRLLTFLGDDGGLFVVPVAGGAPQRLLDAPVRSPTFSPAGDALFYLTQRGDVSALMRLPLDPTAQASGPAEQVAR